MPSLHHLALGANDVERVAGFYRDVFELPELTRHMEPNGLVRSIWLDLGGSVLMVEKTAGRPPRPEGIVAGPFLLAFSIDAVERDHFERRLEAAGALIESRTEFSSYARDPEGNRIAVSHYPLYE